MADAHTHLFSAVTISLLTTLNNSYVYGGILLSINLKMCIWVFDWPVIFHLFPLIFKSVNYTKIMKI